MSIRLNQVGNKAGKISATVKNGETSSSIPRGTPVILKLTTASATDDGLAVVLPSTAGDPVSYACKFGVITETLAVGNLSESILFGVANYALVTLSTRSTTGTGGGSWSTVSQASGVGLGIDTANNAFSIGASIAGGVASNAMMAILLDSLTMTASATATTDTSTAYKVAARVFVRML